MGDFETLKSFLPNHYPEVMLFNGQGELVDPSFKKSVPDHFFVQGTLKGGAAARIAFRKTDKTVDGKGMRWIISGEKGEMELSIDGPLLHLGSEDAHLQLVVGREGKVEDIDFSNEREADHIKLVPAAGLNTARLLDMYAKGSSDVADVERALSIHRLVDQITADAGFLSQT